MRAELAKAEIPNSTSATTFDIDKLCRSPLAQSVYAEVLRLRVGIFVNRKANHDLTFDKWSIKKGERLTACSSTQAFDEEIWNAGTPEDPRPVREFWADRFLVYPDDPFSGPWKKPPPPSKESKEHEGDGGPRFSMTGLNNSWIPYSGGVRHCPGRHFAKQEILITAAVFLDTFDVELKTGKGWVPQSDFAVFGFGTMPIKGQIPCRIRRRRR
jgi:cytochrome P450